MIKSRFQTYNHGVLYICESVADDSDFRAVRNPRAHDDIVKIQKLDYSEATKREQDLDFAESADKSLDIKVKTRYHGSTTTDRQVLIGSDLYDIFQVDWDADKTNMFLFLEKVRVLA